MKKFPSLDITYVVALIGAALLGSLTAMGVAKAQTPTPVTLSSEAQIERVEKGADGKERMVYKKPNEVIVVPGDRVVFTLKYANQGTTPATGFRATNPMPGPVQFLAANEDWAEVSVDGGKNWGRLNSLNISVKGVNGAPDSTRPAAPEDVTHVRWVFLNAIAPGTSGTVSYKGVIK
jgi:uncharacterized repeat protein (TIGR01451 family)